MAARGDVADEARDLAEGQPVRRLVVQLLDAVGDVDAGEGVSIDWGRLFFSPWKQEKLPMPGRWKEEANMVVAGIE